MCAQRWTLARVSSQDHPPIAQIPALLDHVQDVGLSAGASQTGEKEDCGPVGRVGIREAVVVVKPIQRDLSSICCLNKLTAEMKGTHNSATCVYLSIILYLYLYVFICLYQSHAYIQVLLLYLIIIHICSLHSNG